MRRNLRVVYVAVTLGLVSWVATSARAQTTAPDRADEATARQEGVVSWYTSTPIALAQQLADKFQRDTGITVQLLRTGGQAVLRRLQQEIAAGRPGADVMTMSQIYRSCRAPKDSSSYTYCRTYIAGFFDGFRVGADTSNTNNTNNHTSSQTSQTDRQASTEGSEALEVSVGIKLD